MFDKEDVCGILSGRHPYRVCDRETGRRQHVSVEDGAVSCRDSEYGNYISRRLMEWVYEHMRERYIVMYVG